MNLHLALPFFSDTAEAIEDVGKPRR